MLLKRIGLVRVVCCGCFVCGVLRGFCVLLFVVRKNLKSSLVFPQKKKLRAEAKPTVSSLINLDGCASPQIFYRKYQS